MHAGAAPLFFARCSYFFFLALLLALLPVELLTLTVVWAVTDPPAPVQVTEYVVVAPGLTTTEPAVPDAVKFPPEQEFALLEVQLRVADCPAVILEGLATRESLGAGEVVAGGGWVNDAVVQGVKLTSPQQVENDGPITSAGLDVCPQVSCSTIPLAESDRVGKEPLAYRAAKLACA